MRNHRVCFAALAHSLCLPVSSSQVICHVTLQECMSCHLAHSRCVIREGVNRSRVPIGVRLSSADFFSLVCLSSIFFLSFCFLQIIEPVCICARPEDAYLYLLAVACRIVWPGQIFVLIASVHSHATLLSWRPCLMLCPHLH